MKVYGYVRISTMKQSINRQITNIKEQYPDAVIIEEIYTGTKIDRPKWSRLKARLKAGDVVVFDEVSRMSRNAEEGFREYQELYNKGIELIFIKEPTLNTQHFRETEQIGMTGTDVDVILQGVNQYLMILAEKQIRAAFEGAQHEVDFLHKRTSEGVREAQRRYEKEEIEGIPHKKEKPGRKSGAKIVTKKETSAKEIILKNAKCFGGTLSDPDVIKLSGVSRNTYYKYKAELREQEGR